MSKTECEAILKVLTGKEYVVFSSRCNEAISHSFRLVANLGRTHLLKQEEGGWLSYAKYAKQTGLTLTEMVTLNGRLPIKELLYYGMDEALIVNSLAGYVANLNMPDIYNRCIQQDILLINDVSASIGTDLAKYGDIVVGSFGKAKPVNLGTGGFFATSDKQLYDSFVELQPPVEIDYNALMKKLKNLSDRREFLETKAASVRQDLKSFDVVAPESTHALNVIVRFESDEQKNNITRYCDTNNLEYTLCPREIRILDDAVSIEIKRLSE